MCPEVGLCVQAAMFYALANFRKHCGGRCVFCKSAACSVQNNTHIVEWKSCEQPCSLYALCSNCVELPLMQPRSL